ncbi:MAG: SAM-dependent chlorinase/fluorinase [Bacteroidetes bacterium]|jgi:S-adenosylmethionine hydrolase|nr:SAM-dependent chlorinase/fluorinase [Bacteroidota bacterium]MBX7129554.1 SAM-dependent chlorinase/fluorinase [Flavobacteriales bacterium]MCC6654699.1 SAM-dependent chlorinase/fluorinase [Flavobacteriales bacterium]HMU12951.1 SAM-dependent chlorinase/fluorinase [Flavobacteriales bacterium]HNE80816.1 SAM-dependent chlorinase/fluorinase [Flavobacteriales bacterium]
MPIITLTSDMGLRDHYVGAVKGSILSQFADAHIVDISHQITPFDNMHAAFTLRNAWAEFPVGTIHIIGVNSEADGHTPHLVVRHMGHYFIGADNGIFSLLFDGKPNEAFELTIMSDPGHTAFPIKSVFVKAACHLARGGAPETIGRKVTSTREQLSFRPSVLADAIKGVVIHIDSYGNVVTNITRAHFNELVKAHTFRITFGRTAHDITTISNSYGDVPSGERVAFFGATGFLEIAVNKGVTGGGGGAAQLLGLRVADPVRVELTGMLRNAANG